MKIYLLSELEELSAMRIRRRWAHGQIHTRVKDGDEVVESLKVLDPETDEPAHDKKGMEIEGSERYYLTKIREGSYQLIGVSGL